MLRAFWEMRIIIPAVNLFRNRNLVTKSIALTPNIKNLRAINSSPVKVVTLLGLLWPLKKEKPKENVKTVQEILLENGLKEADLMFDNGQFNDCCDNLKSLKDQFKENVEILWRLSRALYQLASKPDIGEKIKSTLANEAFNTISEAIKLDDNHFAVHKWMSVIIDLKSSCEGTSERIKNLEVVKKHMMRATEINPSDATTLYMLGEWCYRIADLPWYQRKIAETLFATPPTSTFEEALSYFTKAEVVEPNFYSMNWLMLGKSYLKLGNKDAAKHYLTLALSYPARTNEDHQANKEAQELLKSL